MTYPAGVGDESTFVWADNENVNFVSTGPDQFLVRAAGGAAINSNAPAGNALRVNGTLRVDTLGAAGSTTLCRNTSNQIATCSSSARYKTAIEDLDVGLGAVEQLRAVAYRWKDSDVADVGFVAEEVAALDERLVTRNAKGEVEGVRYERLTALLANAVQELSVGNELLRERDAGIGDEVTTLGDRNVRLEGEIASMRAHGSALQRQLDELRTAVATLLARDARHE